ncbi:MAG: chromate transporter [Clostridiales bacterium]|nr:chromate transporter [Clostridiales bacterium]
MMELFTLCFEFFKTGLFAVGGGLATLPFLTQMQQKYQWFTATDLANMIAVSESTPGPIGVNMATYVGYMTKGIGGGLTATLSLILPSLIVILIIARALDKYQKSPIIQNMFAFMRPAVTGLIAAAGMSVLKISLLTQGETFFSSLNWVAIALFAIFLALTQVKALKKIHPIAYIAVGAVVGVLLQM